LLHGIFTQTKPLHNHFLQKAISAQLATLLNADYGRMSQLHFSRAERTKLIESMVEYYQLHIPEVQGLQSLPVLQSLFD
jgi:DNA repair protein RecO (recombination protein O)